MSAADRTELEITDASALRALVHPARQRLIMEFYSGEILTATEAAGLVGLSPSATSYHLRALEKAGIVVRDTPSADGRERPWRSAADHLTIRAEAHQSAGSPTSEKSLLNWFADLGKGIARASLAATEDEETGTAQRGRLWLTDDEVRLLTDELHRLARDYRGRTREDHPHDARMWDLYTMLLPAEKDPQKP